MQSLEMIIIHKAAISPTITAYLTEVKWSYRGQYTFQTRQLIIAAQVVAYTM